MQTLQGVLGTGLLIGVFFLLGYFESFESSPPPAEWTAKAIGIPERGVWRFEYPGPDMVLGTADDVFSENLLYLPTATICGLELSTEAEIVSFFVPAFRSKTDALAGTPAVVVLDHRGIAGESADFYCAEFCGGLHHKMTGDIHFLSAGNLAAVMRRLPRVRP